MCDPGDDPRQLGDLLRLYLTGHLPGAYVRVGHHNPELLYLEWDDGPFRGVRLGCCKTGDLGRAIAHTLNRSAEGTPEAP